MKKIITRFSLASGLWLAFFLLFTFSADAQTHQNTQSFKTFKGVIKNATDRSPVVFATVFIEGSNIGTVSNSEGEFLLKVPDQYLSHRMGISSLGYKTLYLPIKQLAPEKNQLELIPAVLPLDEVVIRHLNAKNLLRSAVLKIPQNYDRNPVMMTAFYRESIKKNHSYVSVGEAVLNVYKSSYTNILDNDRTTIFKGRKNQAVRNADTLLVKLQGGPLMLSYLDLVKYPGEVLNTDLFEDYNYTMAGVVVLDGRETYEIKFTENDSIRVPLYQGSIFLDAKSLAFVSIKFEIPPDRLNAAVRYFVRKKPAGMKTELLGAHYYIKYRKIGDLWFLNYVRAESQFKFKWKKKLFASKYTVVSEGAVTDINKKDVIKPKFRDRVKSRDFFTDKVTAFEDPEFWGASNIIEPEGSIQNAIKKISRKLRRWNRHNR